MSAFSQGRSRSSPEASSGSSAGASSLDVLSDGPLEQVLTFLDCRSVSVAGRTIRDAGRLVSRPGFVLRLARLRGFALAPAPPMVDARATFFHLDATDCATVEELAVLEDVRALGGNSVIFHLATLSPVQRSTRLVSNWALLLLRYPFLNVRIDAHCGVGAPATIAPEHSVRRALTVAAMLKHAGVEPHRMEALAWGMEVGVRHFWPPSQDFARAELYAVLPHPPLPPGPPPREVPQRLAPSLPHYYDDMIPATPPLDHSTIGIILGPGEDSVSDDDYDEYYDDDVHVVDTHGDTSDEEDDDVGSSSSSSSSSSSEGGLPALAESSDSDSDRDGPEGQGLLSDES